MWKSLPSSCRELHCAAQLDPSQVRTTLPAPTHDTTSVLPTQVEDPQGSVIFSYVQTDAFCDATELSKAATTSPWERANHLVARLLREPRARQQMLGSFRSMYIMADLGG